ncbi:MAG: hypothetical protein KDC53_07695 [Saprospiraceae bacterium]|nr:hypothetical protein [Saprospiraceae bacterium]
MIRPQDDQQLWKFIDSQMTPDELTLFNQQLETDGGLKERLSFLQQLESGLEKRETFQLSAALRDRILNETIYKHEASLVTANLTWKNLRIFIFYNAMLLLVGIILAISTDSRPFQMQNLLWEDVVQTLDQPLFQYISIICFGVLMLLALDQYLIRRSHQKETIPV